MHSVRRWLDLHFILVGSWWLHLHHDLRIRGWTLSPALDEWFGSCHDFLHGFEEGRKAKRPARRNALIQCFYPMRLQSFDCGIVDVGVFLHVEARSPRYFWQSFRVATRIVENVKLVVENAIIPVIDQADGSP